jgi:glycerophosphoryl diester phosphodiesterase
VSGGPSSHVYSHRGACLEEEEHSFAAYDLAIRYGSEYIEQDAVRSKDGTLYVSHDLGAKRLTGVDRDYSEMCDQEIDQLRTYGGNRVLKLRDVLTRYGDQVNFVIELKSQDKGAADAFCSLVEDSGLEDRIIVQCYSAKVLEQVEERFPDMPKLFICKEQKAFEEGCQIPFVDIVSVRRALLTRGNCALAHRCGKKFNAWVLNTRAEIRKAIELGVDTYFTDDTRLALEEEEVYGAKKRQ